MESAFELISRDVEQDREAQQAKAAEGTAGAAAMEVIPTAAPQPSQAVLTGMAAGNINIGDDSERMQLSGAARADMDRHDELLEEFERRKKLRELYVPTDDADVRKMLRGNKHPVCLFGEGPAERRERLREILAALGGVATTVNQSAGAITADDEDEVQEVWYHEGDEELKHHRCKIAQFSMRRARDRLKAARVRLSQPDAKENTERQRMHNRLRTFGGYCSQVGDNRPIASCQFSPDGTQLATASWSGLCKLWSVPDCNVIKTFRGHSQRTGCMVWHPQSGKGIDRASVNLVSSDADGCVKLWSLESDEPVGSLEGHGQRVPKLAFHPSGRYLGTTCYDHSWRLWDMTTKTEILHQEGHSRPTYTIAFHGDGSLVGTGGLDAHGRVWDLRSGKCILVLQGHTKEILGMDFSSNGYHCVTGSDDHTVRLWDMRQRKSVYTIPAHTNLVSSVKYHADGEILVTTSFDNTAKIWAMPACSPLKTLKGHESKVMCGDISPDLKYVVTASYDRTFKLWAAE
eukprot:m.579670 g.579670  ORF g.579670 m.579670 type:complete len:517 (+) comp22316_c1_seq2:168-1718(+)